MITSSYLSGEETPLRSERYRVQGIACKREQGEFNYCDGLQDVWMTDQIMVNVEHDMEFSDELVDGLVNCPHPLCAYPYKVYPTALGRYIYCATSRKPDPDTGMETITWLDEGEEWAFWSSIGFCKIAPSARTKPLDRLFWQWIEHSINRSVGEYMSADGQAGLAWHIHWPEVKHYHDYEKIPDHLW